MMLENSSGSELTIDGVSLVNASGLEVIGALAVPDPGDGQGGSVGAGASAGFPPLDQEGYTVLWDQAAPAAGMVVPAGGFSIPRQLVVGVKSSSAAGAADGLEVRYHDSKSRYVLVQPSLWRLLDGSNSSKCEA